MGRIKQACLGFDKSGRDCVEVGRIKQEWLGLGKNAWDR